MIYELLKKAKGWASGKLFLGIVLPVVLWRALLELVNQTVPHMMKIKPFYPVYQSYLAPLVNSTVFGLGRWVHWDGYHYLGIVEHGYHTNTPGVSPAVAFFPAFPSSVRVVCSVLHTNPIVVGLVINLFLTMVACWALYKLAMLMCSRYTPTLLEQNDSIAKYSVLLFLLCPASLFLSSFYADALLVAAFTLALYFCLEGKYYGAGLFSAIAIATKSTGIVLIPALMLIVLENEGITMKNQINKLFSWRVLYRLFIVGFSAIVGLLGYMIYLWHQFGDPVAFYKVQSTVWHRHTSPWFLQRLWGVYYQHTLHPAYYGGVYQYLSMLIVQTLPILITVLAFWYGIRRKAYWVPTMSVLVLLLALSSAVMQSLNRYGLVLTPLFVVLATLIVEKRVNKYVLIGYLFSTTVLLCYFAGGFLQGRYFAG
jgi:Gpi18-like mannosyltransferase